MRKFQLTKILDYNDFSKPVARQYILEWDELDHILDRIPEVGDKAYNIKAQLLNKGKATFRKANVTVRLILQEFKLVH